MVVAPSWLRWRPLVDSHVAPFLQVEGGRLGPKQQRCAPEPVLKRELRGSREGVRQAYGGYSGGDGHVHRGAGEEAGQHQGLRSPPPR